jgi:tetratricopeptide (TPR) repeat protein
VELYFRRGLFPDAIEAANPIFKQNLRSDPVPGLTYCNVLAAYLALGDVEQADVYAQKLQQLLKSHHALGSLYENSFLFVYFVHRRKMKEARKLFDRYVKWAVETKDLDNICLFMNGAVGMFQVLSESKHTMALRLPTELPWYREDGTYSTAELATEIELSINNACGLFDSRNQNSAYSHRIQFFRKLCLNGTPS